MLDFAYAVPLVSDHSFAIALLSGSLLRLCYSASRASSLCLYHSVRLTVIADRCYPSQCLCLANRCLANQCLARANLNFADANQFHSLPLQLSAVPCLHVSSRGGAIQCLRILALRHAIAVPLETAPSPCLTYLHTAEPLLRLSHRGRAWALRCLTPLCHYLKIELLPAALRESSFQTNAPLPELRHCPRPLNSP